QLNRFEYRSRRFERSNVECHHPAEPALLFSCECVLRVRNGTRIVNFSHFWVLLEKRRDRAARLVVLLHSQGQGLRTPHDQPGVERRQDCADTILHKPDPVSVGFVVEYHHTTATIRVNGQILGSRVNDDINTELQRTLEVRRHKGVVANHSSACSVSYLAHFFQVGDNHHRVGRCLEKHHLCIFFDCVLDVERI